LRALATFGAKIKQPQVKFAVFFYAGHGVQIAGKNFLVPVTASIRSERDIETQAVELTELLRYMNDAKNKNFLVILDACRDDPFKGKFNPKDKGLNSVDELGGTLLAFATAPGRSSVEFEGEKNGLYTGALIKQLQTKGAKLEDVFKRTRTVVRVASRGLQIPWESTSLEQDLYLFPTQAKKLNEEELAATLQDQMARWQKVRVSRSIAEVAQFVDDFPTGFFSEHATVRLNALVEEDRKAALEREAQRQRERERQAAIAAQLAKERADAEARALHELAEAKAKAERERQAALAAQQQAQREREAAAAMAASARAEAERIAQVATQKADAERRAALAKQEQLERELAAQRTQQAAAAKARLEAESVLLAARKQIEQLEAVRADSGNVQIEPQGKYAGYSEKVRQYRVGDVVRYRIVDQLTRNERPRELRVTKVDSNEDRVEYNRGEFISDQMGNIVSNHVGRGSTPRQFYPAELFVGKRWSTRYVQRQADGVFTFDYDLRVTARESVTVPAGTFDAFRIEATGRGVEARSRIRRTIWVVPGVIGDIAHEYEVRLASGKIESLDRMELVAINRAP
jgi:uncharacterized caspase-like protein